MNSRRMIWLLCLIPLIAFCGCEGDMGPAGPAGANGADGTDGTDGVDGANGSSPSVCLECHNDVDALQTMLEYAQSGHKAGEYVGYAGGREDCAQCHSKQGFLQFAAYGEVTGAVSDPAPIDCATCHMVHPEDFGVRLTDPVTLLSDPAYILDFGIDNSSSHLCANCHQSRRAEPNISDPGETFEIENTHYGPHHGPQANVLEGQGFAEIDGSTPYPTSSLHLSQGAACVSCHMFEYDVNAEGHGEGGHTWATSLNACNDCHFSSDDDFDHGGVQTENQEKLDILQARLTELGVLDAEGHPVVGTYPMVQAQGFFNWIGLVEDRSLGAHNPAYFEALLDNTIEALAP